MNKLKYRALTSTIEIQAELYNEYAAEDKLLNFQEFSELYKVECGSLTDKTRYRSVVDCKD